MKQEIMETAVNLVKACERAYNRKIQTGSGGNVSARIPGADLMLVAADFDGNLVEEEGLPQGKPTKEAVLHGYIYKVCPAANAVVHVHSPYAIAWSSFKKDLPLVTWHSKLKFTRSLPTINVQAAMVQGSDLPLIEEMFQNDPELTAFLLADHGAVAIGKNAIAAEHTAELIEETAQVAVLEKLLGMKTL